jgi:hypothetical protein
MHGTLKPGSATIFRNSMLEDLHRRCATLLLMRPTLVDRWQARRPHLNQWHLLRLPRREPFSRRFPSKYMHGRPLQGRVAKEDDRLN